MRKTKDRDLSSVFAEHITSFIELKRRDGYQFVNEARILFNFDHHISEMGFQGQLTQKLALEFAALKPGLSKNQCERRYRVLQHLSVYLSITIPNTQPLPARKVSVDKTFRSHFADYIASFIELRKRLGYQIGEPAAILLHFDRYLVEMDYQGPLTQELALNFATSSSEASKNRCARKYQVVRQFSDYLANFISDTPPLHPGALKGINGHALAHIYSEEEMTRLMNGARRISRADQMRNITIFTIVGLAASTGLRISEVTRLDRGDVDIDTGILTVRCSKFQKDRLVPVHPTTLDVLRNYFPLRDARFQRPATSALFINTWGRRFSTRTLERDFLNLTRISGLRYATGAGPRFHDLRHTFAVKRLVAWYREGKDVQAMLPLLATYMGHVSYRDTAYYLTSTAELLGLAAERYEAFLKKGVE